MFALSPPSDHLWASHLALQTSAFLLLNAGRQPKRADAPSGGGERSAPRTWEVPGAALGPRSAGPELPLRERGGGAPPFPPRHGGRSARSQPPAGGERLPSRARRGGGGGGRRGGESPEPAAAEGPGVRRTGRSRAQATRPSAGTPRPGLPRSLFVSPLGHAGRRGALGASVRGSRPSRGCPGPLPHDFHFPAGENLGAASLARRGRER